MCVKHENFTWKITAGCFLNEIFDKKLQKKNLLDKYEQKLNETFTKKKI